MSPRRIDLRNQFAMAALPAIISAAAAHDADIDMDFYADVFAEEAFQIADEMLRESEKVKSDAEIRFEQLEDGNT